MERNPDMPVAEQLEWFDRWAESFENCQRLVERKRGALTCDQRLKGARSRGGRLGSPANLVLVRSA